MTDKEFASMPRIAITMGDPAGIGPEIVAKALATRPHPLTYQPVVVGSQLALERALETIGKALENIRIVKPGTSFPDDSRSILLIDPLPLAETDITYGNPSATACHAAIRYIETAAHMAIENEVQAVCTAPIHKANLHRHGFSFPGHTEFLRHLTQARQVVMMLAGPQLRVSLVTIHEPLNRVPQLITPKKIIKTIEITAKALIRDFRIDHPHLAVAGLNPHAGEDGRFGREEQTIITPAIEMFKSAPFRVAGPFSADTIFHRAHQGEFDAVVAMYHDQGLIPIKLVHFHTAVNVSLGLPIIRTSVDHGTAYDLAGTGKADPRSLEQALAYATLMARNRFLFSQ